MPMSIDLTAATTGGDDAEAIASALEHIAAQIRAAGGDSVRKAAMIHVPHAHGGQDVHYNVVATG